MSLLVITYLWSPECTKINSYLELKKVLEKVKLQDPGDFRALCIHLGIHSSDCDWLDMKTYLTPGGIAKEYFSVPYSQCWERIIRHLCVDFEDTALAKAVADAHDIFYSDHCNGDKRSDAHHWKKSRPNSSKVTYCASHQFFFSPEIFWWFYW